MEVRTRPACRPLPRWRPEQGRPGSPMQTVLIVVHLIIVLALIGVVLLQRSEGGLGLGGGGGTQGFMTGRGQANALTRATAILAALFFTTSMILAIMSHRGAGRARSSRARAPRPRRARPAPRRPATSSTSCASSRGTRPRPRPRRRRRSGCPRGAPVPLGHRASDGGAFVRAAPVLEKSCASGRPCRPDMTPLSWRRLATRPRLCMEQVP